MIFIFDVEFYQRENGQIPVNDFLLSLTPKLRAKAFSDIELLKKHGSELKEPYVKPIKGKNNKGLYELRIKFANDTARIFYFTYYNNKYILLHGFVKKSMNIPVGEINRARKYMEDYKRRNAYETKFHNMECVPTTCRRMNMRGRYLIIQGGMTVSSAGVPFDSIKADLMLDNEFKEEYEKLKTRYDIISQIIEARKENNMTQSDLAKLLGTQKSNVSRLESGNYNPSLDMLIKIAKCLGKELSIQLK